MKTKVIAAAVVFALSLAAVPAFSRSSSGSDNCANMIANSSAYAAADVERCRRMGY
jgi:hypothetical protein